MPAPRLLLAALLLVAMLPASTAAPPEIDEALDACPARDRFVEERVLPRERFFPDHQLLTIPPGGSALVHMRLDMPVHGEWVQSVGFHDHVMGRGERAALLVSLEGPFDLRHTFAAFLSGGVVDLRVGDLATPTLPHTRWDCGVRYFWWTQTLGSGDYWWVVGSVSDGAVASGLLLPPGATVVEVTPLPVQRIDEDTLACGSKVRVAAGGLASHQRMEDCSWTASVDARAYWAYETGAYRNDRHVVWWTTPDAAPRRAEVDVGRGGAGEYRLDVPVYDSPLTHDLQPGMPFADEATPYGVLGLLVRAPV